MQPSLNPSSPSFPASSPSLPHQRSPALPHQTPPAQSLTPGPRPPKSSRRPPAAPLSSPSLPLSSSFLAPDDPSTGRTTQARLSDPLTPTAVPPTSLSSTAPAPRAESRNRPPPPRAAMLASHPSRLPHYYDSTASTTEDDADSERDGEEGEGTTAAALRARKREDARTQGRRKGRSARFELPSAKGRSVAASTPMAEVKEEPSSGWEERRKRMPVVEGRDGLGFVIEGLGGADYDALVGEAAAPTYTSSLGSGISSPATSPVSTYPPNGRVDVLQKPTTSSSDLHFPSQLPPSHLRIQLPNEGRVRFDQPYQRSPRDRGSSASSYVDLEPEHIVFPDTTPMPSPQLDSRRTSAAASSLFSSCTAGYGSPATSAAPSSRLASPALSSGSRARSPRLPAGPSTMAGETLASRTAASKLYFPPAPARSRQSSALSSKSPTPSAASSVSLAFPSRPQQDRATQRTSPFPQTSPFPGPPASTLYFPSPTPSTASSVFPTRPRQASTSAAPFPTRSQARSTSSQRSHPSAPPSPASSQYSLPFAVSTASPFPPPPPHSPHARFVARNPPQKPSRSHLAPSTFNNANLPISPSFASAYSTISVAEPVFPTLNAKLEADGIVRAGVANRRVSQAPWEQGSDGSDLDELDRMMRAQRREDETSSVQVTKVREERRKSIHAELLKQASFPPNLADLALLPGSPAREQDEAFHRVLLASETRKKTLGSSLLSDSLSQRRPSPVFEDPPLATDDTESENSLSLKNKGMTPSSSTSSEMSLPSFPDVPGQKLYFPPAPRPAVYRIPHGGRLSEGDEALETLEEEEGAAAAVTSRDFAQLSTGPPSSGHRTPQQRLSLVSDSGLSQYADASEDVPPPLGGLQESSVSPVTMSIGSGGELERGVAELQTSRWVLDTLANRESPQRDLGDIGEEEEELEVVEAIRHSRLFSKESRESSSAPVTPLMAACPPIPVVSPARSQRYARTREDSANSSLAAPPSPGLHRTTSPSPSNASRSSANSSAAVSYTLPKRNAPTSSGFIKPKLTLGRKLGNFFSSTGSSTASGGISSRDIFIPPSPHDVGSDDPFAPSPRSPRPPNEWDGRTSLSASVNSASGVDSKARTAPPSPSNASSVGGTERDDKENLAASQSSHKTTGRNAGLDDLLSRFEREEKERIRAIAQAKKTLLQQSAAELAPTTTPVSVA